MCFVCGRQNPVGLHIHFYEDYENQQVIAPLTIPEQYQGYPGVVHGGVLASILDETAGRAVMMGESETPFWVTAKLEMRYRQPTPTETSLRAVGWVVRKRSRSAEVAGEIQLPDGTVTAELSAVVVRPPAETLKAWEQEKAFWRVDDEA
jgi:uncharacterized protein (TIGR00369 family)